MQMGLTMKQESRRRIALTVALMTALLTGGWANAQLPGKSQPKHYSWSDASLSPDVRADMVIKEMTLDEKILLLHGQGVAFSTVGPTESNGGAGYTKPIPRLGIPSIQMADSASASRWALCEGVTQPRCPIISARLPRGIRSWRLNTGH
jgi:hypothetical protein